MNFKSKYLITVFILTLLLVLCFLFSYIYSSKNYSDQLIKPVVLGSFDKVVTIYLGEGFKNPGFYEVSNSVTIKDILLRYPNNVDINTVKINLSQNVSEGLKLDFKAQNKYFQSDSLTAKKDINTASINDLETISGIGPVTASAIYEYVKNNGPITNINDLDNVKGVGEKTLEEIKKYYE